MTDRTLEDAERNQIKSAMLARATGSGVDIDFFNTQTIAPSIVNPDAETGDMTGWTASGGVIAYAADSSASPFEGGFMFFGGLNTAASNAYQDIDVSSISTGIDAGGAELSLSWYQRHANDTELARMYVEFFDASASFISETGPNLSKVSGNVWKLQKIITTVPSSTRTIRLYMDFVRDAGTQLNAYIDAISASILVTTPSENSVLGGLQDPYIPGFLGAPPPSNETSWLLDASFVRSGHTLDATQTQLTNTSGGANYLWWVPTVNTLSTSDDTRYYWEVQMGGGATDYNGYSSIVTQAAVDAIVSVEDNPVQFDSLGRRGTGGIWRDGLNIVSGLQTFGAGDRLMMLFNPSTGQVWTGVNGTWDNDPSGSATSNTITTGQAVYYIALQGRDLNDGQKLISAAADLTYTPPGAYTPLGDQPPSVATLLDSTKYTGSGNISQAHVFDPSTTLAVVVVNNIISTSGNPITPVMTINGEVATREASTYYSTGYTEGAFAFSVSNPSSGDIVYAGGAGESWMMTVYEFSNAVVGSAVGENQYSLATGSPVSALSAVGDYVIHAITLGRQDGETVTSFSGGAFESHDPVGAYYTGASAIVEDASGTYSWSFTGGADSYYYRVAIPILNA